MAARAASQSGHLVRAGASVAMVLMASMPCSAHMMSMSSGEANLQGDRLEYTLTMPLFEIAHMSNPGDTLPQHMQFGSARMLTHECHTEAGRESYICQVSYQFATPPETLDVVCTFPSITVPNHVHLLRATRAGKRDRAVFDSAFTHATLRFRPPTAFELAAAQIVKGGARVFTGVLPLLFLIALALAASGWRQLAAMTALFLLGQLAGATVGWQPAPRFLECAAALAVAYLAVEVLFLPNSPIRLLLAALLGLAPGLVLAQFVSQSETGLLYSFAGTALADLVVIGAAALLVFRFPSYRRVPAALALVISLGWCFAAIAR